MYKYFRSSPFIFFFLFVCSSGFSQKRTTVYAEFLGNGFALATANVDYRIGGNDKGFGIRGGYSYGESANILGMVNYLFGANKHKLEVGAGVLNFYDRDNLSLLSGDISKGVKPTVNISYRCHGNNGLMLKVGWTPFIIDNPEILYTWLGIGVGWRI